MPGERRKKVPPPIPAMEICASCGRKLTEDERQPTPTEHGWRLLYEPGTEDIKAILCPDHEDDEELRVEDFGALSPNA